MKLSKGLKKMSFYPHFVDKGGGLGQQMWIIKQFYYIIIKSANMDKGGGEMLVHKMWIKIHVLFF